MEYEAGRNENKKIVWKFYIKMLKIKTLLSKVRVRKGRMPLIETWTQPLPYSHFKINSSWGFDDFG